MNKKQDDKKIYVILKAILMSKEYQDCYKKYIATKDKKGKELENQKAWYEIARKWGILEPIAPDVDVETIPVYTLKTYFQRGGVLLNMQGHRQLSGDEEVSDIVDISIDLRKNKTIIKQEVVALVTKLQALRNDKWKKDVIPSGKTNILYFNLGDFDNYELCNRFKKDGRVQFYTAAKKKLSGQNTSPEDIDSYGKFLEDSYKRANWLIKGGYQVLMKSL